MIPTFETERLRLRPPLKSDLDNIYRLGSSEKVMRYISNGKTQSYVEAKKDLDKRIRASANTFGYWVTEERYSGKFIGWLALKQLDTTKDIEVGYRFLEDFWGKGYATEGSKCLLEYAFATLKLPKVVAVALKENKASIKVMEKLGMQYIGEGEFYGFQCVQYEIIRKDFFNKWLIYPN